VHLKKVEKVRQWLKEAFEGGPSGALKKYRVRFLVLDGYILGCAEGLMFSASPFVDWTSRNRQNLYHPRIGQRNGI